MFEQASRMKLRFETERGSLSAEDLWDLPLTSSTGRLNLDEIALDLHGQLKGAAEVVSFVDEAAKGDPVVQLRFDLVKHIIDVRKKENAEALAAKDRQATKQRLMAALERKRDNKFETMSEEDLHAELAKL